MQAALAELQKMRGALNTPGHKTVVEIHNCPTFATGSRKRWNILIAVRAFCKISVSNAGGGACPAYEKSIEVGVR